MENQEAIEILKDLWRYEHSEYYEQEVREALEKGIEALKNRNSTVEELEKIKAEIDKWRTDLNIETDNDDYYVYHGLSLATEIIDKHISELKGE